MFLDGASWLRGAKKAAAMALIAGKVVFQAPGESPAVELVKVIYFEYTVR